MCTTSRVFLRWRVIWTTEDCKCLLIGGRDRPIRQDHARSYFFVCCCSDDLRDQYVDYLNCYSCKHLVGFCPTTPFHQHHFFSVLFFHHLIQPLNGSLQNSPPWIFRGQEATITSQLVAGVRPAGLGGFFQSAKHRAEQKQHAVGGPRKGRLNNERWTSWLEVKLWKKAPQTKCWW